MKIELIKADPKLAEMFYEYRQDIEVTKFNPLAPSTLDSLRERLSKASSDLNEYETAEAYFWFVKIDGEIVGNVTIQNINKMMLTAEIGYGVMPKARGRGVATMAVQALTTNVFEKTKLRKLIAYVHEENLASIKVLEKIGYRKEGILREHYLVNGKPANEVVFGILRGEHI